MKETSKSKHYWHGHYALTGTGLDVGSGDDCLPIAAPWDKEQGDATRLIGVPDKSYDFVYSSHCLEHIVDVPTALKNWARVARKYLYIVVPDYELYEHSMWPSRFNGDHKHSFSLNKVVRHRRNHWMIDEGGLYLNSKHMGVTIALNVEDIDLQSDGFDLEKLQNKHIDQTMNGALAQIRFVVKV